MQDLRIILIILGAVAIAALLIHGLWTSQKGRQKNIGDKPINKVANQAEDQTDDESDGFDNDGVGPVRVVSNAHQAASLVDETNVIDDWHDTPRMSAVSEEEDNEPQLGLPPRLSKSTFSGVDKPVLSKNAGADKALTPEHKAPDAGAKQEAVTNVAQPAETETEQRVRRYQEGEIDPLFDVPEQSTPEAEELDTESLQATPDAEPVLDTKSSEDSDAEYSEPEVDTVASHEEPQHQPEPAPKPVKPLRKVPKTWQDVYVIHLVARPNKQLQGHDLIRALTQADFSFGEMDIFHRHHNAQAQGEPLFSVINMVNPGTFNPNAMAEFSTPGISVFMQLPQPSMAKNQFNLMVQAAENMAETLDGILLDAERRPLSPDYLAQCREQLRDFDSQAQ